MLEIGIDRTVSGLDHRERCLQIGAVDRYRGAHRGVGGRSAGKLDDHLGDGRQPALERGDGVGQQIVVEDVVAVHARHVMGERGQKAGAILARRAVDQDRALVLRQRLEIAGEEIQVTLVERRAAIIAEHIVAKRAFADVGGADELDERIGTGLIAVVFDQPGGEPIVATRGGALAFLTAPQIDDDRDIQGGDGG